MSGALMTRQLPVRYFALLIGALAVQGADTARLLKRARLDAARFEDTAGVLQPAEVEAFLAAAHHVTGRTDLGFETGRLIKLNSHDILGYGMLSCRDLDHLLRLTSRYYHVINPLFSMRYRRTSAGGEAVFNPLVCMPLRTMHFVMEAIAVSVQNQIMMLLGPAATGFDIRMGMPAPAHLARYGQLLPARFHFDEGAVPAVTLQIGDDALRIALPMASGQVVEQIEAQLATSKRRPMPHGGWGEYITMLLRETVGQQLTLDDIARRMNISARTIDRNLKKERLQFRELSQQVRFDRARDLLAEPGVTVSNVAEQLGFSDAANFARAFRRRSGVSASAFQDNPPLRGPA